MRFENRADAGEKLMDLVNQYRDQIDMILAIPRGGVEVAEIIARELNKPLALISARKIGAPHNPEVAIGAVAPDGSTWYNEELVNHLHLDREQLEDLSRQAGAVQAERRAAYGSEVNLNEVADKGVLVVDDGAATGATLIASIEALRRAGANPVGAAVPVASIDVVSLMEDKADFFLALETPGDFLAVGQYYREFGDVSDQRVHQLLGKSISDS